MSARRVVGIGIVVAALVVVAFHGERKERADIVAPVLAPAPATPTAALAEPGKVPPAMGTAPAELGKEKTLTSLNREEIAAKVAEIDAFLEKEHFVDRANRNLLSEQERIALQNVLRKRDQLMERQIEMDLADEG